MKMTVSALQTYLKSLLESHNGEVKLVMDNAASTLSGKSSIGGTRCQFPPSASLLNSSSHSCARWLTDEASPKRDTVGCIQQQVAKNKVAASDLPLFPLSKNHSSPAFPVRKLSPRNIQGEASKRVSPSSVFQLNGRLLLSTLGKQQRVLARPPRSPQKNSVAILPAPLSPQAFADEGLRPPTRLLSQQQEHQPSDIVPPPPPLFGSDHHGGYYSSSSSPVPPPPCFPTRGLSATLGTDLPVAPPVAPIRRPSAQVQQHQQYETTDASCSSWESLVEKDGGNDNDDDGDLVSLDETTSINPSYSSVAATTTTLWNHHPYHHNSNSSSWSLEGTHDESRFRAPDADEVSPSLQAPTRSSSRLG